MQQTMHGACAAAEFLAQNRVFTDSQFLYTSSAIAFLQSRMCAFCWGFIVLLFLIVDSVRVVPNHNSEQSHGPLLRAYDPLRAEPWGTPLLAHFTKNKERTNEEREGFAPKTNSLTSDTSSFSLFFSPRFFVTPATPTSLREPNVATGAQSKHETATHLQYDTTARSQHELDDPTAHSQHDRTAHLQDDPTARSQHDPTAHAQDDREGHSHHDPAVQISAHDFDDIRWDETQENMPVHLRQRYEIEDPWEERYKRIIVIGDVHGDYSELIALLEDAKIITNVKSPTEWEWATTGVIVVSMGDLIDRGTENMEVLDFFIHMEATAVSHGNKVFLLRGNTFLASI